MSEANPDLTAEIAKLVARHMHAVAGSINKEADCHWRLSERWSYGEPAGWVIEHDGCLYEALEYGEDGPFPTLAEAQVVMCEHLLAAIAEIESRR